MRKGKLITAEELDFINSAILRSKTIYAAPEAATYLGIALSSLYKLTSAGVLQFSKPGGKLMFFQREILDEYLLRNVTKAKSQAEIAEEMARIRERKKNIEAAADNYISLTKK
jgi:excisionase family DNA binding protein